jgi:hypothetical protein
VAVSRALAEGTPRVNCNVPETAGYAGAVAIVEIAGDVSRCWRTALHRRNERPPLMLVAPKPDLFDMRTSDDWRLCFEADWMYGAQLHFRGYKAPSDEWDHDHCSLCWAKFTEDERPDTHSEGYVLEDDCPDLMPPREEKAARRARAVVVSPTCDEWICRTCFDDFREHFGWRVHHVYGSPR